MKLIINEKHHHNGEGKPAEATLLEPLSDMSSYRLKLLREMTASSAPWTPALRAGVYEPPYDVNGDVASLVEWLQLLLLLLLVVVLLLLPPADSCFWTSRRHFALAFWNHTYSNQSNNQSTIL